MLESIILGAIQGIAEWLPVSSEGLIVLIKTGFFSGDSLETVLKFSLFLHLGTFLAALLYFRKEVWLLSKSLLNYQRASGEEKRVLNFLIIATFISGGVGYLFLGLLIDLENQMEFSGKIITAGVGVLLLITAYLQLKKKSSGVKSQKEVRKSDGLLLGLVQGLAVLPGLSRSGLTVSTLLLRKFNDETSLRLSFLMSLPVVLAGNILLNYEFFNFNIDSFLALIFSFIFGLATISFLIKIAEKVNFGYFVLGFGALMIGAAFI